MRKTIGLLCFVLLAGTWAQGQTLTLPPSGDNQKSSVTQWIGPVSVTITYNSPDVTGPDGADRAGKIWGGLVPWGLADNNFGSADKIPWRGGANENTTIAFSHDVYVEGKELKAGQYGLHFIPQPEEWTVIFSNNTTSWGSYFYDPSEDALRVTVVPRKGPYTEWLTYDFVERKPEYAIAAMKWEEMVVPFRIDAPVNEYYLQSLREELRGSAGFDWRNWVQAASFCANNDVNLEEALQWADYAISAPFVGEKNFTTLQSKAMVLIKLDKLAEADAVMDEAMTFPDATMSRVHQYGRQLIAMGRPEKALEVFQHNNKKYSDDNFTTIVGLARGFEAVGNMKKAIRYYYEAAANAPQGQGAYYESLAKKLEEKP